jgi:hypothetical protein
MRKAAVITTGAALTALACGFGGLAGFGVSAASNASSPGTPWPTRLVLREPLKLAVTNQVIDARARTTFELSAVNHGAAFRIRKRPFAGGHGLVGPRFPVNGIALAARSLWVFGTSTAAHSTVRPVLYQVSPRTLAIVRRWTLAPAERRSGFVGFTADGDGTVWVGFLRTILHIDARTGSTIGRIRIGAGLTISDVTIDPAGRHLYAVANTPVGGTAAIEFSPVTGRKLASNARGALRFSVGGGRATAVPGGVWVSFRTGSMGETLLLAQERLRLVKLPGSGSPGGLFTWAMFASTEYAGGSLLLARQDGIIACLAPTSGHIRARSTVSKLIGTGELFGASQDGRTLYGLAPAGVIAISPPAACRR